MSDAAATSETLEPAPPRRSRAVKLGLGLLGTGALVGAVAYFGGESEPDPNLVFAEAMDRLDRGDYRRAANLARYLRFKKHEDVNFGGGVAYVIGLSEFELGDGFSVDRHTAEEHYKVAAGELTAAFADGLVMDRRPRWAYATGLSLFRLGRLADAEPRLEEAIREYEPGFAPVAVALAECDLVPSVRTPARLDRAVGLTDRVLASPDGVGERLLHKAWLLRAEATLARDGVAAADAWTLSTRMPAGLSDSPHVQLLLAKLDVAAGRTDSAAGRLEKVLKSPLDPPETARAAAFLLGRLHERAGDEEAAIAAYRTVIGDYDFGDETVAAAVALGDLLRSEPRNLHEDALEAYSLAVQIRIEPEKFRNRFASLDGLRDRVRAAWQAWLGAEEYARAVQLADRMAPLFQPSDAAEMEAVANRAAAADTQRRFDAADETGRAALRADAYAAWRASGRAYAELADARTAEGGYADALWTSSEHFVRGRDFVRGLEQTRAFLDTRSPTRRPQAMVQAGRLLLDLHRPGDGRIDEAKRTFETVLAEYPAADAAFDARYSLGECALETDDTDAAETHWRAILDGDLLNPSSRVWQDSLGSLGELLFHTGERTAFAARKAEANEKPEDAARLRSQAAARWESAVVALDGYLNRSPQTPRSAEARFWMAKSLQRTTEMPRAQLDAAETNNARLELERQIETALKRANTEFAALVRQLRPLAEADRLDPLGVRLLRDSTFEIPHTHFLVGDYEAALAAYSEAATLYQDDPQVLLAYLQSARCLEKLGRPAEARSQLTRAAVIRGSLKDRLFGETLTSFSGPEWDLWLDRSKELMTPPGAS